MENLATAHICYKCDCETLKATTICPDCGHPLRTPEQIRRLGWVLAVIGSGLTVFIGGLTVVIAGIIWQPLNSHATTRFTGGPEAALLIFGILGVVMLFGITSLFAGIWQIRHGRRNKHLTSTVLTLAVVLVLLGTVVRIVL